MGQYEGDLRQLYRQKRREEHLHAMIRDLQQQERQLREKLKRLKETARAEQADVDRLERQGLTAFFYTMIGQMDEKLDRERQEAYAARCKYSAAAREHAAVTAALREATEEWERLRGSSMRFDQALARKKEAMKAAGSAEGLEVLRLEARIGQLESREKEFREAVDAGAKALEIASVILEKLMRAGNWATVDMVGGGVGASVMKHGFLDEAQELVEQLQVQLRSFRSELLDVTVQADFQVSIDGSLRFADYFFDDLFADWVVMDRIMQSRERVQQVHAQLEHLLEVLSTQLRNTSQELEETRAALERHVIEADLMKLL